MRTIGLTGVCRAGDLKHKSLSETTKSVTVITKLKNGLEIQVKKRV